MGNSILEQSSAQHEKASSESHRISMITFDDLSRAAVAHHAAGRGAGAELAPPRNAKRGAASSPPATSSPSPTAAASPAGTSAAASITSSTQLQLLPRTQVLHLGAAAGTLCASLLAYAPLDPPDRTPLANGVDESTTFPPTLAELPDSFWSPSNTEPAIAAGRHRIAQSMGSVFLAVFLTAAACGVELRRCILSKLDLNAQKYPVELCRGKSGKYTDYSHRTGITADRQSQSTVGRGTKEFSPTPSKGDADGGSDNDDGENDMHNNDPSIAALTQRIRAFATDRQWARYHTPRNLALALMGEVGELAELFQWRGDGFEGAPPGGLTTFSEDEVDHVRQELADVAIYLLRLADVCGVDLAKEAMELTTAAGVGNA